MLKRARMLLALLCALPLVLGFTLAPAGAICPHGQPPAATSDATPCPCCNLAALTGAACSFACQPAVQQAALIPARALSASIIRFPAIDQQVLGWTLQPPDPPPRTDLTLKA